MDRLPQYRCDALYGLPLSNRLDRLLTHNLQRVVIDGAGVGVSFAFHVGILP